MLTRENHALMMFKSVQGPTNFEIRSEFRFLNTWKTLPTASLTVQMDHFPPHKIMCIFFCVRKSVILMDFATRNKAYDFTAYSATLKKLYHAFQNKRHGFA